MQIDSPRSSSVVDFVKQKYAAKNIEKLTISDCHLAIYADYYDLELRPNSREAVIAYNSDLQTCPSLVYNSISRTDIYKRGSR